MVVRIGRKRKSRQTMGGITICSVLETDNPIIGSVVRRRNQRELKKTQQTVKRTQLFHELLSTPLLLGKMPHLILRQ